MQAAENSITLCQTQVKKIGDLMVRTKDDLTKDQAEMRKDFSRVQTEF